MWANVGGIKAKLEAARGFGVGLFILPEETWALLERLGVEDEDAIATWDEELQAYARRVVRPAKTFADVIHAAVEGEGGTEGQGPRAGSARGPLRAVPREQA